MQRLPTLIHALRPAPPPAEAFEPALMIDLTPLAVSTPESIKSDTLTAERPTEIVQPVDDPVEAAEQAMEPETAETVKPDSVPEAAEPATMEAAEPEVVPEATESQVAEAVTPETAEPVEPEESEPDAMAEPTAPEITEALAPEVVLPLPRQVAEEEPKQPKAEPRKKAEKAETKKAKKATTKKAETDAPRKKRVAKADPAPKANASKESRASKAPTVSPAKWQSRVLAWLNRHKRYPGGAKSRREQGTVRVSFAINASGNVISASISRSSGNSELDQAALDMVRRSSPVPAPPPEIAKSRMSLSLPVQFNLK